MRKGKEEREEEEKGYVVDRNESETGEKEK